MEVSRDVGSDRRYWRVAKSKDGADGSNKSFSLTVIGMGVDADGEDESSCVVAPASSEAFQVKSLTQSQQLAMDALTTLTDDLFGNSSVHRNAWRDAFNLRMCGATKTAQRQAFGRAVTELAKQGRVCVIGEVFSIPSF